MSYNRLAQERIYALLKAGGATKTGARPSLGFFGELRTLSALPSVMPILRSPAPQDRAAVRARLMALQPQSRPLPRRPAPAPRPVQPPAPVPQSGPQKEIDITPQDAGARPVAMPTEVPRKVQFHDSFHGEAPGFNEADGAEFGDFEADLGLD